MTRKERKKLRKNKGSPQQISEEEDRRLWELAKILTKQASERLKSLPINDRFLCDKCKLVYCVNLVGEDSYCQKCFYRTCCRKEIQDYRTCENCKEEQ